MAATAAPWLNQPRMARAQKSVTKIWRRLPCAALAIASFAASAAETSYTKNPETGIESWEWRAGGVTLQLGQITPGLAQGFYLARGFDAASADLFAINCAFMAVLRNESAPGKLHFNLADWRVAARQQTRPLKLDTEWQKLWERRGVPAAVRTAFHWAQLPTEHVYETGDWNMGMLSMGRKPGERFDLRFRWKVNETEQAGVLTNIRCAADDR
ncbi:MAG TPA: hypothetical protein VJB18_08485 [Burkholderiales bacterium]|nr:hypothetical protein [Burkholderiales bacterium]